MKQICILTVSALLLLCSIPLSAAAEENAGVREETLAGGGDVSSDFTGTIRANILSVELPCRIGFQVEPGKKGTEDTVTGQVSSQFTGPTEAMVINNSNVPIKVEVIKVDPVVSHIRKHPITGEPQSIRLVGTLAGATEPGTAIMALRTAGERFETAEEFEQYALLPGDTQDATMNPASGRLPVLVTEIRPGGKTALQIYGQLCSGSSFGSFSFQVTPYLKVSPR